MATRMTPQPHGQRDPVTARGFFRWYDLWVGAYWDRKTRTLHVCPLPMVGVAICFEPRSPRTTGAPR